MVPKQRRMEISVSTVIDTIPENFRALFVEIIGGRDARLLDALRFSGEPSRTERESVEDILSSEFMHNLRPDNEPTDRGRDIDSMLGAFLLRWPIEHE